MLAFHLLSREKIRLFVKSRKIGDGSQFSDMPVPLFCRDRLGMAISVFIPTPQRYIFFHLSQNISYKNGSLRTVPDFHRFSPNIYLTLNILTSIIWIVVLFNIVSIKGNCAEQRLFENNGYVNRGKLAFAYHFSLPKFIDIRCASAITNSHWVEIQQAK